MAETKVPVHPVQVKNRPYGQTSGHAPQSVTMRAYEVYCEVYSPQEALVEGGCRGGFSTGELVGFLYARSFPKEEWSRRVQEAFRDLDV